MGSKLAMRACHCVFEWYGVCQLIVSPEPAVQVTVPGLRYVDGLGIALLTQDKAVTPQ